MNNKWVLIVLLAIAVLFGVMLFSNSNKTAKTENSLTESKVKNNNAEPSKKENKSFTLEEVAKHDNEKDCWMVIESKVYDVTEFIPGHPGGKAILNGCGKDATVLFNERPTDNKGPHPENARTMLEKLYLGDLKK